MTRLSNSTKSFWTRAEAMIKERVCSPVLRVVYISSPSLLVRYCPQWTRNVERTSYQRRYASTLMRRCINALCPLGHYLKGYIYRLSLSFLLYFRHFSKCSTAHNFFLFSVEMVNTWFLSDNSPHQILRQITIWQLMCHVISFRSILRHWHTSCRRLRTM